MAGQEGKARKSQSERVVCRNPKAAHSYEIEETYEAGMVLLGSEVKALREGKANIKDGFVLIKSAEVFLHNSHISHYGPSNRLNHDPERVRKLLLHAKEIRRLIGKTRQKAAALVPLSIYFKDGKAKVLLGLGRGKKLYDKREEIKKRDAERELRRMRL